VNGDAAPPVDVLLIGGRSGAGKTSVALEVSAQLQALGVPHCHVEGDNLDAAYPKPIDDPFGTRLTEANLAAVWRNYAGLGHHRLIYVNTVSVMEPELVVRAVGGEARVVAVLLAASDETVQERLTGRETGSGLRPHLERSRRMAELLTAEAPDATHRVSTDGRTVGVIATEIVRLTGWAGEGHGERRETDPGGGRPIWNCPHGRRGTAPGPGRR
jgi:Adenylylsulphate kinase